MTETNDPGPEITADTVGEAQKLAGIKFDEAERELVARGVPDAVKGFVERRKWTAPNGLGPASVFDPRHPGMATASARESVGGFRWRPGTRPLPKNDEDVAFAPVTDQAAWIRSGALTSVRLTGIYVERLKRYGPKLECVVTLMEKRALRQARRADEEIAEGKHRGPLHGIPWGAKDLFDTAGVRTTWGANPYRDRVPDTDATVVRRLDEAGAVLVAKLTLGALAYGDVWFGGKTRNPFNLDQGSSGSSAGSAAATAAGLVGFALGTETLGSIVSPCMRCGTTGLRPTFGRVSRAGAMALCWSLDKVGPLCRTVQDTALVLAAVHGEDPADPATSTRGARQPLSFDALESVEGRRVGYVPDWFQGRSAIDLDRKALDALRGTGVELVEIALPDLPYASLRTILDVEAAAAFEELTLTNRDDELVRQDAQAWPNAFRRTWFVPAVELVQARRLRRRVCEVMRETFLGLDAVIGPSFAGPMLLVTNNTGHPSLTLRTGFRRGNRPHGITLWGGLHEEGTLCRIGMELEAALGVWDRRPKLG